MSKPRVPQYKTCANGVCETCVLAEIFEQVPNKPRFNETLEERFDPDYLQECADCQGEDRKSKTEMVAAQVDDITGRVGVKAKESIQVFENRFNVTLPV